MHDEGDKPQAYSGYAHWTFLKKDRATTCNTMAVLCNF